ncbi:DUF4937 domain-containing protein [Streptomyces sp. NPDC006544]|uniref:DUF4937 domain-containing protein n=1 Tax=Streptomyces sp. NPDC006544 TaxID=3154583 RepID=UPI0033A9CCA4
MRNALCDGAWCGTPRRKTTSSAVSHRRCAVWARRLCESCRVRPGYAVGRTSRVPVGSVRGPIDADRGLRPIICCICSSSSARLRGRLHMWGKWIGCRVPVTARERFSAAQSAWSTISDQPGLVGQVGGWDTETGRAHVLGLWSGAEAYRCFMRERHDAVVVDNRQSAVYTGIDVATGEIVLEMGGDSADLSSALESAVLLRVADCRLLPGRKRRFLEAQREVWTPGMAAAGGMLAGVVTRLDTNRYLVTTLWSGSTAHQRYVVGHLPALRSSALPQNDIQAMTGHVLSLEASWRVLPDRQPAEKDRHITALHRCRQPARLREEQVGTP